MRLTEPGVLPAALRLASLHLQLLRVEATQELQRIERMAALRIARIACALGTVLMADALVLIVAWETPYRRPAAFALLMLHVVVTLLASRRLRQLDASERFAASREQLRRDLALVDPS